MNKSLIVKTLEFDFWIVVEEKWNEKIIPYATALNENKSRKSLCDTDTLWCQKEMTNYGSFQKILIIEESHCSSKSHRMTGINNEIIYTLLNILK